MNQLNFSNQWGLRMDDKDRFVCCLLNDTAACRSATFRAFSMPAGGWEEKEGGKAG